MNKLSLLRRPMFWLLALAITLSVTWVFFVAPRLEQGSHRTIVNKYVEASEDTHSETSTDELYHDNTIEKDSLESVSRAEKYKNISHNKRFPTLKDRMAAVNAYRDQALSEENIISAMGKPSIWDVLDSAPKTIPLSDKEKSDDRVFIRVNVNKIAILLPGDILDIAIPQLQEKYTAEIYSKVRNANGSVTWHGRIPHEQGAYEVTLTQSASLTMAGVSTPSGHYAMQTNDGEGWVASSETLFTRDSESPDYLIPAIEGENNKDAVFTH